MAENMTRVSRQRFDASNILPKEVPQLAADNHEHDRPLPLTAH
jgi:hypothetical protein